MVMSSQQTVHWQAVFSMLFCIQFLLEIVIVESVSCLLVHVWAPLQFRSQIRNAFKILTDLGVYLCKTRRSKWITYAVPSLDAPKYFFPSHMLASHYPHLIESAIIHSYHTNMLENTAFAWRHDVPVSPPDTMTMRSVVSITCRRWLSRILRVIAKPSTVHSKLYVHAFQTLFVFGIALIVPQSISSFIIFSIIGVILTSLTVLILHHHLRNHWKWRNKVVDEISSNSSGLPSNFASLSPSEQVAWLRRIESVDSIKVERFQSDDVPSDSGCTSKVKPFYDKSDDIPVSVPQTCVNKVIPIVSGRDELQSLISGILDQSSDAGKISRNDNESVRTDPFAMDFDFGDFMAEMESVIDKMEQKSIRKVDNVSNDPSIPIPQTQTIVPGLNQSHLTGGHHLAKCSDKRSCVNDASPLVVTQSSFCGKDRLDTIRSASPAETLFRKEKSTEVNHVKEDDETNFRVGIVSPVLHHEFETPLIGLTNIPTEVVNETLTLLPSHSCVEGFGADRLQSSSNSDDSDVSSVSSVVSIDIDSVSDSESS